MIEFEAVQDGFILAVDGRRVLAHSKRAPCLEIGASEAVVRRARGGFRLRGRSSAIPLRFHKIYESGPDFASIDFEGKLRLGVRHEEGRLRFSFSRFDSAVNVFRFRITAFPDESIYGCGERLSRLDLKGRAVALWVDEPRAGPARSPAGGATELRGASRDGPERSGFPAPVFVSSRSYWCAVDTCARVRFDFRHRGQTVIDAWGVPREVVLGFGQDPKPEFVRDPEPAGPRAGPAGGSFAQRSGSRGPAQPGLRKSGEDPREGGRSRPVTALLGDLTAYLGRQPPPPAWTYDGAWLAVRGGLGPLRDRVEAALAGGAKLSAVVAPDWRGAAGGPGARTALEWAPDPDRYEGLAGEIELLRSRGIRFVGLVEPLVPSGVPSFAEASRRGYFVKDRDKRDYLLPSAAGPAAMVDLTRPEAFEWIKERIKRDLLGLGMGGWLADGGGCLPPDAAVASGESPMQAHNRWPVLWARANREAIEEAGASAEATFACRTGWLGSSRYANSFWTGEGGAAFLAAGGLRSSVPSGISLGLSGMAFWHSEAGGAAGRGRRGAERLRRWMEMAAFSPAFRGAAGGQEEDAGQWSEGETLALLARMTEVFAELKPYHVATATEHATAGLPPMRHPWIHYEEDARTRGLVRQYLYGRDLMVAPVLAEGRSLTSLYLPDDEWIHLWTSREFGGGAVTVETPLGYPAVFFRSSSPFAKLFDAIRRTVRRV